jgi:hypothetical protein
MRSILIITFMMLAMVQPAFGEVSIASAKTYQQFNPQEEARHLWEQAIAAKGGRERLRAVRNMVVSTHGEYTTSLLKRNQVRREELLVFPNKYWFLDDYGQDVFGLRITMYNYDTNVKYIISEGEPHHAPEPITEMQRNKALRNGQLSFLLESQWLKPILVKASTGIIGLHPVDIVQTTVGDERVDFAFDQKTHLPIRVSYYNVVRGKTYINVQSFSDYTEVNGIKVPLTIVYYDGSKYKASFQFNVEYNDDIFVKPPSISAGPEAWKMAKR